MKHTIGNLECTTRTVKRAGEWHGELLIDGEIFDITATCGPNETEAEKALTRMITRYQEALEEESAFGEYVRDVFANDIKVIQTPTKPR